MDCRKHCGACCIAPSITSPIPGMPEGKPAGKRCIHLTEDNLCSLFNSPLRPEVCKNFKAEELICGSTRDEALERLHSLEHSDVID